MLFIYNDKTNLITQRTERNARANHQMWSWLEEAIMRIESLSRTQAGVDWLRYPASRSKHVRSNRNVRRLWHQPEH